MQMATLQESKKEGFLHFSVLVRPNERVVSKPYSEMDENPLRRLYYKGKNSYLIDVRTEWLFWNTVK